MEWKELIGKRIFVKLNSGNIFNAIVDEVTYMGKTNEGVDSYLIGITDKFGKFAGFKTNDILIIKEEDER